MSKTAFIPSIRIQQEFREDIENVLTGDETLSNFVLDSVRTKVEQRKIEKDFSERAMASRNKAKETGVYVSAEECIDNLERILVEAKKNRK